MDLNVLVNSELLKMQESGKLEEIVQAQLQKTVKAMVEDVIGSYSDFGKDLKTVVKNTLAIDVDRLELPTYNVLVRNILMERLSGLMNDNADLLKARLDEVLGETKSEYKLSEIIHQWMEGLNEDHDKDGDSITFSVEKSYGSLWIYIDEDEGTSKYNCAYQIAVDPKKQQIFAVKDDKGRNLSKESRTDWGINGIAETFFRIYASGAILIVDEDEVETSFGYDD